jgi:hypothetical protein
MRITGYFNPFKGFPLSQQAFLVRFLAQANRALSATSTTIATTVAAPGTASAKATAG